MERKYLFGIEDGGRTAGMVSYFFVIGWSIGYFGFHQPNKTSLSAFHLRQSLFLYLTFLTIWFGSSIIANAMGQSSAMVSLFYFRIVLTVAFLALWATGLSAASNSSEKGIPVLGQLAQNVFAFI